VKGKRGRTKRIISLVVGICGDADAGGDGSYVYIHMGIVVVTRVVA